MSSQPVHAIAGRTLRHWTISSQEFVGGTQQPSQAVPYSEDPNGDPFQLLASKLTQVKTDLARRDSEN